MSKNTQINIWNEHDWELDPAVLYAVMHRMAAHVPQAERIEVYPQERNKNGFLEWVINIKYHVGSRLTIGCVQRKPEAPVEFHT